VIIGVISSAMDKIEVMVSLLKHWFHLIPITLTGPKSQQGIRPLTLAMSSAVSERARSVWLKPTASPQCDRHLQKRTALQRNRKYFTASQHR